MSDSVPDIGRDLQRAYDEGYERGKADAEQRWIPVSERLPEVGSEVLVCFDFKGMRSVYISGFYGDGEFLGLDDEYLTPDGRRYRKAVAWMPLPEPYKAESEEDNCSDLCTRAAEQPEKHTEEHTKSHACNCISRQAAFDEIVWKNTWNSDNDSIDAKVVIKALRNLPSVEPERKTGKWIKVVNPDTNEWTGGFKCSECDRDCVQMSMNFCANCGSRMEVDNGKN